jgi:hypothetical protein
MEKIVTLEGPFMIGGVTLIAVVRSLLTCKCGDKAIWLFGFKFPIALVLISDSSKRAYRANGEEVSIEQLLEENPDIGIELSRFNLSP